MSRLGHETVGKLLSAKLKDQGMSQSQLAKKSGISRARISDYIKYDATPGRSFLSKLIKPLSLSATEKLHWFEIREIQQTQISETRKIYGTNLKISSNKNKLENDFEIKILLKKEIQILGNFEWFPDSIVEKDKEEAISEMEKGPDEENSNVILSYLTLLRGRDDSELQKKLLKKLKLKDGDVVGKHSCSIVLIRKNVPRSDTIICRWKFRNGFNSIDKTEKPKFRLLQNIQESDLDGTNLIQLTIPQDKELMPFTSEIVGKYGIYLSELYSVLAEALKEKHHAIRSLDQQKKVEITRPYAKAFFYDLAEIKRMVFSKQRLDRNKLKISWIKMETFMHDLTSEVFLKSDQEIELLKIAEHYFRTQASKLQK